MKKNLCEEGFVVKNYMFLQYSEFLIAITREAKYNVNFNQDKSDGELGLDLYYRHQ